MLEHESGSRTVRRGLRKVGESIRFLVVDLGRPSTEQKALVARFYRDSIPTLALLDRNGRVVYNEAGETARKLGDTSALEEIIKRAQNAR